MVGELRWAGRGADRSWRMLSYREKRLPAVKVPHRSPAPRRFEISSRGNKQLSAAVLSAVFSCPAIRIGAHYRFLTADSHR